MSAGVIKHSIEDDPENDPDHPIPYLRVLDVATYLKSGGGDFSIIVATPIQGDERSQRRLLDKIQTYLAYCNSDEYRSRTPPPTPETTRIIVRLHPDSSVAILQLLEKCYAWVRSERASLAVEFLTPKHLGLTTN